MTGAPRSWGASLGGIVGYVAALLFPQLPRFVFYPRLGEWTFADVPGEPGIRWFGMLAYALAGACLGAIVGAPLLRGKHAATVVWIAAAIGMLVSIAHEWSWFTR